jgi:hypothetical protein
MSHTAKFGNLQSHKSEAILLILALYYKHNKVQLQTSKDRDMYKDTKEHQITCSIRVNPLTYLRADFSL